MDKRANPNFGGRNRTTEILDFISKWGTVLVIVFLIVFFSIKLPGIFLNSSNLINILRSISTVTIIATGVTFSLAVGGFDLSVGSAATFASTLVISMFVWYNKNVPFSIAVALLIVLVVAVANSLMIVKFKIFDMLSTLAAMFIFEGVALTYSGGGSISAGMPRLDGTPTIGKVPNAFKILGQSPGIIIIMLVVVVLATIFLRYTKHGRYMYVVGGNREAARLSGINVNKYKALAYFISTLLAGLGGLTLAARNGSAQTNVGAAYLMPSVAAAYIGLSVAGAGKANPIGTLVGAVLVGILENGLVMMSVPYYSLNIIKGLVLALALITTYARKKD